MIRKWIRKKLGIDSITLSVSNMSNRLERIESLVKIGVDYHYKDESWAVICIAGNPEYVQFRRLKNNDARTLLHILKDMNTQFTPPIIDAPMCFRKGYLEEL